MVHLKHLETTKEERQKRRDTSGTQLYHHAKLHADWPHHHRDICPRRDKQIQLQQI